MPNFSAISKIEALIRAKWVHCDVRGFDQDPVSPVPRDLAAFAELTFPVEPTEEQISTGSPGNNTFREEGGFAFTVMVPRKDPLMQWLQRIDELRDGLRNWRSDDGHLRIFEVPSPAISNRSDQPGYRELTIGVAYQHDIFR